MNAVVTGGASGLGRATLEELRNVRIKVAIFDLNQEQRQQVVAEFGAENVLFSCTDVTSDNFVEAAFDSVIAKFGRVDICINCAGIAPAKKVLDREKKAQAFSAFSLAININLTGSFNVARLDGASLLFEKFDADCIRLYMSRNNGYSPIRIIEANIK